MITPIKQTDPRWTKERLGNSMATMGRYGCYVSSLCMALEKLRGYFCDPRDAVRYWKFTARGLLMASTTFKGMKRIKKVDYYNRKEVEEYTNSKDKAVILCLNYGAHFIYVDRVENGKMIVVDPLVGDFGEIDNVKITGMRVYEATKVESPEWMKQFIEKAESRGLKENDYVSDVNVAKIEAVLFDLGLKDKKDGKMSIGELLAAIQKISERW
jgi:hypothetical protein